MARWTRRHFTSILGASLLAAPLAALMHRGARAGSVARRLVIVFSPNGTHHPAWRPTGGKDGLSFPSGSILEPLAAHASKLIVCDGINFAGVDNHEPGMTAMLTGGGGAASSTGGTSVDQYVAKAIGSDTPLASLELGVLTSIWGGSTQTRMCYSAPGQFAPPDDNPTSVYKRIFGDSGGDQQQAAKLRARRESVIDLHRMELYELRSRLGQTERLKLAQHATALDKIELSLQGPKDCSKPESPAYVKIYDNDNFPAIGKQQMDLLVLALACGTTKVASLQWSHTVSPTVFSWLGQGESHHSLSHSSANTPSMDHFIAAERWYAEQFAYLLEALAATPDPEGGMLLDSTLVVWCKEIGDGRLHDCLSVPFVLTGGGYFETNRYLKFDGQPHQKLLVSICHAMGLTNQTFGDATKATGPLEGLS